MIIFVYLGIFFGAVLLQFLVSELVSRSNPEKDGMGNIEWAVRKWISDRRERAER